MKNYRKIIIVKGEAYSVTDALKDLEDRLNCYEAEYDFINSIVVSIENKSTPVSGDYRVYAIQVLGQK